MALGPEKPLVPSPSVSGAVPDPLEDSRTCALQFLLLGLETTNLRHVGVHVCRHRYS